MPKANTQFRVGICQRCGTESELTKHHIQARSRGGQGTKNIILICHLCHRRWHLIHGNKKGI